MEGIQNFRLDYVSSSSSESDSETQNFIARARQLIDNKIDEKLRNNPDSKSPASSDLESSLEITNDVFMYENQTYPSIPPQLHGTHNFSQIIKSNSQNIINCLTQSDKEKLFSLMPNGFKDKDKLLT